MVFEQLWNLFEIDVFVKGLPFESGARPASLPGRYHPTAAVTTHLRPYVPVAFLHVLANVLCHLFRLATISMRIHRHSIADLAAQQIENGHVCPFAFDVPQRHVECAENVVLNGAVAPIRSNVSTL